MTPKLAVHRYFWIITIVILVACGTRPTEVAPTTAPTLTSTFTPTPTLILVSPNSTIPPATSTPASLFPVSSAPDGLRMAYVVEGNLYFQQGSNPPIQLTDTGQDWRPLFFSENGEKLFFLRGVIPFALYAINADGSQEQALVTNTLLLSLGMEYDESTTLCKPTLIVDTQLLFFNTCVYPDSNNPYIVSGNGDLLTVDTATGEVKRVFSPGQVDAFYVSPDGKLVAIDTGGQIDVIDIHGKITHNSLLTYLPSEPILLAPHIYWTQDAATLTVLLPVPTFYDTSGGAPPYTIWRYTLDNDTVIQVHLDPPPKSHNVAQVSPDGNWILYENDELNSFILGDLREGRTQLYALQPPVYRYEWSLDNTHFLYDVGDVLYLGSVANTPTLIGESELIGWVDADQYLYYDPADKSIQMRKVEGETVLILSNIPAALFPDNPDRFIFAWSSK